MISNWLSAALARRNLHYGWVIVAVTFFTALISAGTVGAPGVFIEPLQHEFGWTTAEISSALSVRFILFGLMAPFAAALLNRYGLRNVTLVAQLIVVSALVASLAMTKVWQLMLLWGVVIGIGTGMTALVLGATIATRWFTARRGLVVGILTASVATGQLVFLPLLASLTERFGWRIALALICVMLGVSAFAVLLILRDRPSDIGLRPFGDAGSEPLPAPAANNAPIMAAALGTLREAAKTRVFWILFATFFICGASTNGLIQVHLIPMCLDFGIPQVQAASLLAAMGVFDFFGTIISGWLSDRYDNRYLLVLRPARPVAGVLAIHRFLVLWAVTVCDVLWARLDRDRAADGAAHRATVRRGARQPRVRLGVCRPSARCRYRGLRRRPVAHDACDLSAGVLCRGRAVHHRVADCACDRAAAEAGGSGVIPLLPRPALAGEGRGEGLSPRVQLGESPPHP
jgi:MFS family permease